MILMQIFPTYQALTSLSSGVWATIENKKILQTTFFLFQTYPYWCFLTKEHKFPSSCQVYCIFVL